MRIITDDATGTVLMWSETGYPQAGAGQTLRELTPEQKEAFVLSKSPHGLTFDGQNFTPILPPPVPVPATAQSGDFVAALCDLGWYDQVEAAASAAGGKALALWRHASTFERYNPILIALGRAIGKTDADLDALFRKTREYQ
jgi:hypothetical protein